MPFARFMASPLGRGLRIVAGFALILWGLRSVGGATGWIYAAIGTVVLAMGIFNVCVLAPILGAPFRGSDLRSQMPRS